MRKQQAPTKSIGAQATGASSTSAASVAFTAVAPLPPLAGGEVVAWPPPGPRERRRLAGHRPSLHRPAENPAVPALGLADHDSSGSVAEPGGGCLLSITVALR